MRKQKQERKVTVLSLEIMPNNDQKVWEKKRGVNENRTKEIEKTDEGRDVKKWKGVKVERRKESKEHGGWEVKEEKEDRRGGLRNLEKEK